MKIGDIRKLYESNLPDEHDTHPTVAVAELMRILLDDYHLEWQEAWDVTTKACAYTNHTIMAEALEKWLIVISQTAAEYIRSFRKLIVASSSR